MDIYHRALYGIHWQEEVRGGVGYVVHNLKYVPESTLLSCTPLLFYVLCFCPYACCAFSWMVFCRDVKPVVLACLGDIALAIQGEFRQYLEVGVIRLFAFFF